MFWGTKRGFLRGEDSLHIYLCCGWWGLWIAHLFGFSVVETGLLLFMLPAILTTEFAKVKLEFKNFWRWEIFQKSKSAIIMLGLLCCVYLRVELSGVIAADLAYANYNEKFRQGNISEAIVEIEKAVRLTPYNPWLRSELGWASASAVRVLLAQNGDPEASSLYKQLALENMTIARELATRNTLIAQREVLTYAYLYNKDSKKYAELLMQKMVALQTALPNEIALLAQWPRIYTEIGKTGDAKELLQKFVELKPDYQKGQE